MRRNILRLAARRALESWAAEVAAVRSQGVVPGARLTYKENGRTKQAAVRTSKDRKVGLLRDPSGEWRTVTDPKIKKVLIAAPSQDDPDVIEVSEFDPKQLVIEFDKSVASAGKSDRDKGPVFLPLDESRRGKGARKLGLASIRKRKKLVKKSELLSDTTAESAQALEIIRAGIAQGLGISPDRIDLWVGFAVKPAVG